MPALLCTEDVACSANLHVAHGDAHAGAELGRFLNRLEASLCLLGEYFGGFVQEIRVRAVGAAPDTAAELIELCQPEAVGVVDDDGVDVRDVDAGFDDRRADEHVVIVADEGEDHLLQHLFIHLTVPDAESCFRHKLTQAVGEAINAVDTIVNHIHLPSTLQLTQDHFADQLVIRSGHKRADRETSLRRGVDHADVSDANERHVKRARDWRRAHCEDVDFGADLLEVLLLTDAEPLLLVDHDQTEILKLDVLLYEPVRSDNDVYRAFREAQHDLALILFRLQAGKHLDPYGKGREPLAERGEVLKRQHCGRHKDGDLEAVVDCLEGGTERDFGFAESDVAANQPIHRLCRFKVTFDFVDGTELIGRL